METVTIRKMVETFCTDNDLKFYESYSGRGMFGAKCIGIVCSDITETMLDLVDFIAEANQVSVRKAKKMLGDYCYDNMGLKYILYFPTIKSINQ